MVRTIKETTVRNHRAGKPAGMMLKPHDIEAWKVPPMLYAHVYDFLVMGAKEWQARTGL
ncbi:hypothetical protein [Roseomonas xinghualingensis]|uniref:hypothetical protein n=1 Tax=Roseomonas xinghualingensis TaxID=2986475 RepID=UPI0021F0C760|nr:hypothetical protein [Roseomonas sp. SXEYE001]MCV4209227.1 hypothetical protein [Roseomonas sp. SXEYE001]